MTQPPAQPDVIELFHDARIQHGFLSDRIYLMKLQGADPETLIAAMDSLAKRNGYTKIFAKVPAHHAERFLASGYQQEAEVPGFYHGREAALFLGYYLDPRRQKESSAQEIERIIEIADRKKNQPVCPCSLPADAILRPCTPGDAVQMSSVYREVFPSYPFPIDDPEYITKTMQEAVVYFGIEINGRLVALSSAEMDAGSQNVEMTDFATIPKFRGNGFSLSLLEAMEKAMKARGIQTAYTIARAFSAGMNITFAKAGYTYGGRLINNTNISGRIESMNVWYKQL